MKILNFLPFYVYYQRSTLIFYSLLFSYFYFLESWFWTRTSIKYTKYNMNFETCIFAFYTSACGSLSFSLLIFYSALSPLFCFSCLTTSLTFTQLPPTFYRRKTPMSKTGLVEIHWPSSKCYLPLDVLITFITVWYVTQTLFIVSLPP